MSDSLELMMQTCGFKMAGDPTPYKNWHTYIDDVVRFCVRQTRPRAKKQALMLVGIYNLFIEYLAGRLPDTIDEAGDGAVYMARAAQEFRNSFIGAMTDAGQGS